jgi:hypothetical protein
MEYTLFFCSTRKQRILHLRNHAFIINGAHTTGTKKPKIELTRM